MPKRDPSDQRPVQTCAYHGLATCDESCPGFLHPSWEHETQPPVDSEGHPLEGADAAEQFAQAADELNRDNGRES